MKTEHLVLLILVAAAAIGGVVFWRSRKKEQAAANHPVGSALPPGSQMPVGAENTPTVPAKKMSAKDAVALGATVGCTVYFGGVAAPACAVAAPLATDLAFKGGKAAYKEIKSWF